MGFLRDVGGRLLEQGHAIVPIRRGLKHPGMRGWQDVHADSEQLERWLSNGFADGGVGVQCKTSPGVDLDVYDSDVIAQLVAWCESHIGATVQRVGEAPKTLLVYRTEEPFTKIASGVYVDFLGMRNRVEILGDGQQFVAYAVHPGTKKPYEWVGGRGLVDVQWSELPVITAAQARELVAFFESIVPDDWERADEGGDGGGVAVAGDSLANAKPPLDITTERLRAAVNALDPNMGNDPWVRVGMSLYHQFSGGAEGFAIFDEWSSGGATYDPETIEARWRSFDANLANTNPVTAATILRMARSAGGGNESPDGLPGETVEDFIARYVYVQNGDRVCDLGKPPYCCMSQLREFKNRTANVRHEIPDPTQREPDRVKLDAVWKSWLVNTDRRAAEGTTYVPTSGRIYTDESGLDWVNEAHMPEFPAGAGGSLDVFHEHIEYLFPVGEEREWFIGWMAFTLQKPNIRCKVTPLHVAVAHGTGRGWVVELMSKLLGQWNVKKTKMETLAGEGSGGGYHEYLNNSLLCAIEEAREGGRRFSVSDRVRDLLTENMLEINLKYGGKNTKRVFTNFFLMSNHPDALVLTKEDRRINVLSGPDVPRDREYYDRLYGWLETDGVGALYHWLHARDLTGFNWVRSMETGARTRMIENNRTETETLFWELMSEPPHPAMTLRQITRELQKLSGEDPFSSSVDERQVLKLLQHHARGPVRVKAEGEARRAWLLTEVTANDEIRASLTECGF